MNVQKLLDYEYESIMVLNLLVDLINLKLAVRNSYQPIGYMGRMGHFSMEHDNNEVCHTPQRDVSTYWVMFISRHRYIR